MSNYTKTTDFAAKDALITGDPDKIVKGAEFEAEFDNIATAVNSKADSASPTFTGTVTIPTPFTLGATSVTATGAELNILDGVTATTAELNILDGVTSTTAELNILDGVTSTASEINLVDGSVAGTIVNSKAVVYGAAGEVNATKLQVSGTDITATPAEINKLDGVTASTAEINTLVGGIDLTSDVTGVLPAANGGLPVHAYGRVNTAGTLQAGSYGVASATNNSAGNYTITLSSAVTNTSRAIVLVTALEGSSLGQWWASAEFASTTTITIYTASGNFSANTLAADNTNFNFIVLDAS